MYINLYWLSGTLIGRFQVAPEDDVERFIQDMDEGLMHEHGIPAAKTTESGGWQESYQLWWGDTRLAEGKTFSAYQIPDDATINVIVVSHLRRALEPGELVPFT